MIKKIISLQGIGRFEDFKASGDVEFKKYTLIFAENGVGKTTLCDVVRSLQTGDPAYIMGRRTLGSHVQPNATILLADGSTARFQNGHWSKQPSGACTIFDTSYVRENVHAGEVVDIDHKRALFSIIVGQQGVTLHKLVNDLEKQRFDLNGPLKAAKQAVEGELPSTMKLADFLGMQPDPDIDRKIAAAERTVGAVQEQEVIGRHRLLSSINVPTLPSDFGDTLGRTLADVSDTAQRRLDDHLSLLAYERGQKWLAVGLSLVRDTRCPFCAQSLNGNDLVAAYRACFSSAYDELATRVAELQDSVEQLLGVAAISQVETTFAQNAEALGFWSRYCEIQALPALNLARLKEAFERAKREALALLSRKSGNLLVAVIENAELGAARDALNVLRVESETYNSAVEAVNGILEERRQSLQGVDRASAQSALADLQRRKRRFEEPVSAICDRYVEIENMRQQLTDRKDAAKTALDSHTGGVIQEYETTLNRHLRRFLVGFRIRGTKAEYPRGLPSSSYQLVINEVPVELGGESTPHAEASFRNTLSGGDRSALALSLFMSQLERAETQPDIAVILDDPFQSQDSFRKNATAHQIKRCGEQCGQVIVLSHDPVFIKMVWDKLQPDERKALRLLSLGKATGLVEHDVEEHLKPEQQHRINTIQRYVNDGFGDPRDVAQKLRPALEGWCKVVCSGEFPDSLMVGEICGRVRQAGPTHVLHHLLDELEELNDYAKQYHHASNDDHAAVPIVEGELHGYGERILEIMRIRIV